ncbi:hypothetical protein pdam_00007167 [Pocillopora damicornis]|uniref:Uncharacterized protein n=1 Tax=Pocillopora damicornis TaxID=46731 RepID=A0A3M6TEG0_POCDA|nr:hypothetical protein pdam_00007167 [Pocillopora damicornis]
MQGKGQVSEEVINQIIIRHDDYVALWSHGPMVKEKMRKLQEMGFGQLVKGHPEDSGSGETCCFSGSPVTNKGRDLNCLMTVSVTDMQRAAAEIIKSPEHELG